MSDLNILVDILGDGDSADALRWINSSDEDTDYSGWRSNYGETMAQLSVLPQIDMPNVTKELIKRMDKKSLDNRDTDDNCLVTSSVYYPDLIQSLIRTDVTMDTRNADGITVFALLAELGHISVMINIHIKYKVNMSDKESDSALVLSAMNGKEKVVAYLLSNAVDLEEHFIETYGGDYIAELLDYKRKEEYIELFMKYDLLELVPKKVIDIFIF